MIYCKIFWTWLTGFNLDPTMVLGGSIYTNCNNDVVDFPQAKE